MSNKGNYEYSTYSQWKKKLIISAKEVIFFRFSLFCLAGSPKTWILRIFLEGNRNNPLDFGGDSDYNLDSFSSVARKGEGLCPESVIFSYLAFLSKNIPSKSLCNEI